ncbi:hypothetical protein [Lentzea sp. NBRC 102530]|uniref:hypothetical protein n=1 Tax=Lentzea sp. NBRC 102530 TaxID=3032201 RepID=UPI0024A346EB|nr:hypothetical protein [Lentzea sp. NBRC 102530]GLY46748.1 hypothetical protein Lesp01_04040 [Lentzea sp. NBRC 102530]
MGSDVTGVLTVIEKRSPHARIVLVGHGRQVSTKPNPAGATLDPVCGDGILATEERVQGNEVADGIDATLRAAAKRARRPCSTRTSWARPLSPRSSGSDRRGGGTSCRGTGQGVPHTVRPAGIDRSAGGHRPARRGSCSTWKRSSR